MEAYKTKVKKIAGSDYHEVISDALKLYRNLKKKTKRKPYIRSTYFKNEKVFLDYFWGHLNQKAWKDRTRRLKFYPCALELIKNSHIQPVKKINPNKSNEYVYRFKGQTTDGSVFNVQIKENTRSKQKYFMSVYPVN